MGVANRMTSCFGSRQELTLQKPVWNLFLIFSLLRVFCRKMELLNIHMKKVFR